MKEVKVTDKDLDQWKEKNNLKAEENYLVYDNVALDKDEEEFLNYPADHRIILPVTRDQIEIVAEKLVTKIRYANLNEGDTTDKEKDDDSIKWKDNDKIDFSKLRVTKYKTNGRLYPPKT